VAGSSDAHTAATTDDPAAREVRLAGRWLRDHAVHLDAVGCSPAERARQTWALVAAELDQPPTVRFDDRIYDAPPAALLTVVRELPTSADTALLVGHNPGVEEFVALLSGKEHEMKTSSVAVLAWTGSWADADVDAALLQHHATPRG
jgi:phosphohistidine phosphatase